MLVNLTSVNNLGGSPNDLTVVLVSSSSGSVVSCLGLPGASSHRNGTEAEARCGGEAEPGCSRSWFGSENRESFGMVIGSISAAGSD
ncbi:hypothetical protein TorRG33x02_229950 [Trema orientale]|uniref:Uncharacterized protein n=1 Tax=Trema orientale TaxID=63057 RepID=A0A2P5E6U9_TREOI|nr:hypothetical protein TorRG33x02_229950 [Trema orientale]